MLFPPTLGDHEIRRNLLHGQVSLFYQGNIHGVLLAQLKAGSQAGKVPTVVAKRLRTNSDAATSVAVVVVVAVIVMPVEVVLVFVVVWWCLDAVVVCLTYACSSTWLHGPFIRTQLALSNWLLRGLEGPHHGYLGLPTRGRSHSCTSPPLHKIFLTTPPCLSQNRHGGHAIRLLLLLLLLLVMLLLLLLLHAHARALALAARPLH